MMDSTVMIRQNQLVNRTCICFVGFMYFCLVNSLFQKYDGQHGIDQKLDCLLSAWLTVLPGYSRNMTDTHGNDQTKPTGNSSRTCICFEGFRIDCLISAWLTVLIPEI